MYLDDDDDDDGDDDDDDELLLTFSLISSYFPHYMADLELEFSFKCSIEKNKNIERLLQIEILDF